MDPGTKMTDPKAVKDPGWRWWKGTRARYWGEHYKKGDEYPNAPPGLCLVRVLEDQHHPYWVR